MATTIGGMASLVFLSVLMLFGFILWFALPVFLLNGTALFSFRWNPEGGYFGVLPMVLGTGLLAVTATLLAFPMALGVNGFMLLHPRSVATRWVWRLVRMMAGIPTIVYGLAALFLLTPFIREGVQQGSGFCLLGGVLMVVILILPVMVMILNNQLQSLADDFNFSAVALGMTRSQAIVHLVLPSAIRGMVSAILLGFSRAVGDTMLPLMLTGNATQMPGGMFDSIRTLTAHIGLVFSTEKGSAVHDSLFAAGVILLAISVLVTLAIRGIEHRQLVSGKGGYQ